MRKSKEGIMVEKIAIPLVLILAAIVVAVQISKIGQDEYLTPMEKIQRGIYDDSAIALATSGFDTELVNGMIVDPESPALLYLAYLVEGYAKDPTLVSYERAIPRVTDANAPVEAAFGLTDEQRELLDRIKAAYQAAALRDQQASPTPTPTVSDVGFAQIGSS